MLKKSFNREKIVPFSNVKWRNFIKNICKKIDKDKLDLQVISPFGFELCENKRFLYKSIKRFYCYIGIPSKHASICNPDTISKVFSKQLMASISEVGINQSDVAIIVAQDKFTYFHEQNYKCSYSDKLIDIQTRVVTDDILRNYADYIICTVDSIYSKKDEPRHFFNNKRHRCRTYQLYVMLEQVFGYLLPEMSVFEKELFSLLFQYIDNSIQIFYTPSELFTIASDREVHLLNSLIHPRVKLMCEAIKVASNQGELINLQCDAYHVEGKLSVTINNKIYKEAVEKICSTYLNFE